MKAKAIVRAGETATIEQVELPDPVATPGSALIEVRAASVNRADLAALAGSYVANAAATGPTIVGLDAAGIVREADPRSGLNVGDRVMTLVSGGLAERVVVDARLPILLPDSWSFVDGAGAVLGLLTAHNALATAGRVHAGDSVFVNGASSATGQMAVRIATTLGATSVIAGARNARHEEFLRSIGATEFVLTGDGGFAQQLRELTDDHGVDVTIDHVGGPYLADHVEAAAVQGRIVSVGRLGGGAGTIDLDIVALKRLEVIGVTFRTRTADEKADLVTAARTQLYDSIASGALKPRVDAVHSWDEVLAAQAAVASNSHLGKVVLTIQG